MLIGLSISSCHKDTTANAPITPVPVIPVVPDTGLKVLAPMPVAKTNIQKVYVHFMPWFEDTLTSKNGAWGQHWTMANRNPKIIDVNGKRQIASWFYPKTGPYASRDSDVIDYQLLLMKYSGIDGIVIDWWGVSTVYDYPQVKKNTDTIVSRMAATGLQFAICYEDQTLPNVKAIAGTDTVVAAKADFSFLQSIYFNRNTYIKRNGSPLLLCFGPLGMLLPLHWQQAFTAFTSAPAFAALQNHADAAGAVANGEYAWVTAGHLSSLQNFYTTRAGKYANSMAAAYPGFKDYYQQGGWGSNLFSIPYPGTMRATLDAARSSGLSMLQLITWNDYGEGTMIEPTDEYGYTLLREVQLYTGVSYTDTELALIYKWLTLRRKYKSDAAVTIKLKQAYYYLVALQPSKAAEIINRY
jgi:hypothetical protein